MGKYITSRKGYIHKEPTIFTAVRIRVPAYQLIAQEASFENKSIAAKMRDITEEYVERRLKRLTKQKAASA